MVGSLADLTERQRETEADKRLYTEIGLVPVTCRECGAEVAVKKNSRRHTSVQWTADAVAQCVELGAFASGPGELRLGCSRLKASIDAAVRDGVVVVPADYPVSDA